MVTEPATEWNHRHINEELGVPLDTRYKDTPSSFHHFVRLVHKRVRSGKGINEHARPCADVCNVGKVPYHYLLRIEDIADWWPCLEEGLQLTKFTKHGWAAGGKPAANDPAWSWFSSKHPGCFYAPQSLGCEPYYNATTVDGRRRPLKAQNVTVNYWKDPKDSHQHGASARYKKYYTKEIARLVFEIYERDFQAWGYEEEQF